ncbi:MAG: AAA family ATPase [Candidatus Gracilibacteria bacterium]
MNIEDLLEDFNDSTDDNKKDIFEKFTKLELGGKSLKVEAYPGAGKTYLITKMIKYVDFKKEGYVVLSHMNSSISTLESKLKGLNVSKPKVQTLVSFFISYFLVPLGFKISNENGYLFSSHDSEFIERNFYIKPNDLTRRLPGLNDSLNRFINDNLKINKGFGESDIGSNQEWGFIKHLILYYLNQEKYLKYFSSNLKSDGIKYIFFDEYQDTDIEYIDIVKNIIKTQNFIFYITGDINQSISYTQEINFNDISDFLDEIEIEIQTQPKRFVNNNDIFNLIKELKTTNFGISGNIFDFNESISKISFDYSKISITNLNHKTLNQSEEQKFINYKSELIKDFLLANKEILVGKNNVILTFVNTDKGIGKDIITKIQSNLIESEEINILGGEKLIIDFRLPKFIEKLILFIQDKSNSYSEVEKELKYIIKTKDFNFNEFLKNIIKISSIQTINELILLMKSLILQENLKTSYLENNKFFEFLDILGKTFGEKNIIDININENKLYDLFKTTPADKINISINTIHSSKGKEYDNVIILELLNAGYTRIWINEAINNEIGISKSKQYRNMYYVGLSRAKEKIFTCINL